MAWRASTKDRTRDLIFAMHTFAAELRISMCTFPRIILISQIPLEGSQLVSHFICGSILKSIYIK